MGSTARPCWFSSLRGVSPLLKESHAASSELWQYNTSKKRLVCIPCQVEYSRQNSRVRLLPPKVGRLFTRKNKRPLIGCWQKLPVLPRITPTILLLSAYLQLLFILTPPLFSQWLCVLRVCNEWQGPFSFFPCSRSRQDKTTLDVPCLSFRSEDVKTLVWSFSFSCGVSSSQCDLSELRAWGPYFMLLLMHENQILTSEGMYLQRTVLKVFLWTIWKINELKKSNKVVVLLRKEMLSE